MHNKIYAGPIMVDITVIISAILINPIFKISLGRELWNIIDIVWAIILIGTIIFDRNKYQTIAPELESADPLIFEDKKKYKIYNPQLAYAKEVAKPAPHIPQPKTLINRMSSKTFKTAGTIMAYMANFGFPSALIVGFPIIAKAKNGTP